MPNITLIRSHLFEAIGRSYTDKEFDELCFEFGVEVDDVMTEIIEVLGIACCRRASTLHLTTLLNLQKLFSYVQFTTFSSPQMGVKRNMLFT